MDYSADLRDPRQGFLLWRHLYGSPPRDGNSGSPDIAEIALAERVCGAPDRDVAARLSGSRPDLWRSAFAACSCHLRDLLQRGANASRIAQGHAPTPTCPAIRLYCRHANLVWLAPSLCEDMIFGRDSRQCDKRKHQYNRSHICQSPRFGFRSGASGIRRTRINPWRQRSFCEIFATSFVEIEISHLGDISVSREAVGATRTDAASQRAA